MTGEARRASGAAAALGTSERLLVVRVGRERFAFPLGEVLEVSEAAEVTTLPLLPTGVMGQAAHRERLVPVLDAAQLLGGARDASAAGVLLHVDLAGDRAALWVDDVEDMVTAAASQWRPTPGTASAQSVLLDGVVDLGGEIAALVAMDAMRASMRARLTTEAG